VIGIDLGEGVESAGKNTAALAEVQIIQADIFHLPFADSSFDAIFSIGVLMHTGDAKAAARSLVAKLKPGGSLSITLYGKGNPIYEWVDRRMRQWTTRMSVEELEDFTRRAYTLRRALERIGVANQIARFIRFDPHPHCIFDWYAAPIATHHSYTEAKQWFREMQLEGIRANDGYLRSQSTLRKWLHKYVGSSETVTIRGEAAK
jgi:SAM-dependent methyltransferase